MTAIRTAIMTACFMGILSTLISIIAPANSLRKHLMSILGIIALIAVIHPFMADGFSLSLDDFESGNGLTFDTEKLGDEFESIFLEQAEGEYDEYFKAMLNKNNIRTAKAQSRLRLNADNELELVSVKIELEDMTDRERARLLIEQETSGINIEFIQAEKNGTAENTDEQAEKQSE
ncbi:stage III sporulation protein AF [uncultured Ruminococcus sp.]|uniref:stage III sporulation protein AF n=1 Tax=uncultured Ruminococcus sp. TaxID=165186 RepID=UPI000EE2D401|nr:stage III sporulation protein AF [uncultured Ruminococcus sp.]HCJ41450.1 hypothetical protein [Ruminococcus sp.]